VSLQEGQDRPLPLRPARPTQATTRTTTWSPRGLRVWRAPQSAVVPASSDPATVGGRLGARLSLAEIRRAVTCTAPSNLKALKGEPGCGAPSESDSESCAAASPGGLFHHDSVTVPVQGTVSGGRYQDSDHDGGPGRHGPPASPDGLQA
jgi:hypothetical protein